MTPSPQSAKKYEFWYCAGNAVPVYQVPPMAQLPLNGVSRNRRAWGTHVGGLRLSRGTINWRPRRRTCVVPVEHRASVEELWDGTRNPLRRVARIYERRLPSGIQCVLLKQILE